MRASLDQWSVSDVYIKITFDYCRQQKKKQKKIYKSKTTTKRIKKICSFYRRINCHIEEVQQQQQQQLKKLQQDARNLYLVVFATLTLS